MSGFVHKQNDQETWPVNYDGKGRLIRRMYCNATGGLTSGQIVEFTYMSTYGWSAEAISSNFTKKGYVPTSIDSGEYGDIVLEGYCENCYTTHQCTATGWTSSTGFAVNMDSGLNTTNDASAPTSGNIYFGVFVSSSPDSSSTQHTACGTTVAEAYLINMALIGNGISGMTT